jgi:DNA repair protein RadC
MNSFSIKTWAEEDRPREKMLQKGLAALSDAELLAILIGSGSRTESAVQLAQRILGSVKNNLHALGQLSVEELAAGFKGIGQAKAIAIAGGLELGRRYSATERPQQAMISCSKDAQIIFYPLLDGLKHEELWIGLTNQAARVIKKVKIAQGGVSQTNADIRIILREAIQSLASGLVLCHNHPSGNLVPSPQDDALTHKVQTALRLLDIRLLDHIILADNRYYSYADEGKLDE